MKLTAKMTLVALVLLTFGGSRLQAQNTCTSNPCSLNDTVKVTVNTVLRLTLSQAATPLTSPNEAAYDAGFQLDGGPTVSIKANRAWTVKVSSNAATWTAVGAGANGSKASTDLQWATNVAGPYAGVSTSPATDRKSTRLNSSHLVISYAVFCLKKKKIMLRTSSKLE